MSGLLEKHRRDGGNCKEDTGKREDNNSLHTDGFPPAYCSGCGRLKTVGLEKRAVNCDPLHFYLFKTLMQITLMSGGPSQEEVSRAMCVSSQMLEPK